MDDELTPIEPVKLTGQTIAFSDLCAEAVAMALGVTSLPSPARAAIHEWMINSMRNAVAFEQGLRERAEERARTAEAELMRARARILAMGRDAQRYK